jgi:AcrR family transcriptional regulator
MLGRTGGGDPARTLALLWREQPRASRGPAPRLDVGAVVDAAVALADEAGLEAVSMRAVAARLGVSAMTLYGYVPGKQELLDLMVDAAYLAMRRRPWRRRQGWRSRLRAVAEGNRALYEAHPWAAVVSTARPPLGPGVMAKYEHELAALEGVGLSDIEMDAALTFLLGFVQANAATALAPPQNTDAEWWAEAGPLLARVITPEQYPLASRVGAAAGEAQGAAYDPARAYEFGLERVLDGIAALIER